MKKKIVVLGFLGTNLDQGGKARWGRWRPTISLGQQDDLLVDRFELFYEKNFLDLAQLVHITTGTHVIQICLFLLTESRHIPGKLLQTHMQKSRNPNGTYTIIDLDLSKCDKIAERFHQEQKDGIRFLKSGIETRNAKFNEMIRELATVSVKSKAPILLTGKTGVGKTKMARLVYEWKKQKRMVSGNFVELNCATLRGDACMSALFGHVKGAFTDARADRPGKFEVANKGTLFLDEIGNLSYHLQAKLLTALQRRSIVRVGSNTPIPVNIRLICATNRDLQEMVQKGDFREDLLYRINTIHVEIPPLRERPEDIVPLTEIFLSKYTKIYGKTAMCLSLDAKEKLKAQPWFGNIRELEHTIEIAAIIAERSVLDGNDFDFPRAKKKPVTKEATTLEEMEYNMIKNAMDKYSGNLSLVASQLGISRQTLYNKIKRYEL